MSNVQLVSEDVNKEVAEELVDSLPTYFPKSDESSNYKLLYPVAVKSAETDRGIEDIQQNIRVDNADSINNLVELAKLVGIRPRRNENLEHYRTRVISAFQNITNEATIGDILSSISFILQISRSNVDYYKSEEPGLVLIGVPQSAINNSPLQENEIVSIMNDNVPAGYDIETISTGTLTFVSVTEYEEGEMNPDYGYDGLDEDGNPKGNGGTYSTILQ